MLNRVIAELSNISGVASPGTTARYTACIALSLPEIIRVRKLWPADVKMNRTVTVAYQGACLRIACGRLDKSVKENGSSSFSGIREMYARNVYLKYFDKSKICFENVIDAGGNRGLFTTFATQLCSQVVYIEPQAKYRPCLERLLGDNPAPCCVYVENALLAGDEPPSAPLFREMAAKYALPDIPSIITLEEILAKYNLPRVSFLKCDIEGGEFAVFRDPTSWISRIENIAMEVHRPFGDPTSISEVLKQCGFTVVTADYRLQPIDPKQADYVYASRTGALV